MKHAELKSGMKIIGIILLVFAGTVATHEGEFWPFSIYPMFSQAGNPWTRAMVLDVTYHDSEEIWEIHSLNERSAAVISLRNLGVDQIDFSNFVSKTEHWSESRKNALSTMFSNDFPDGSRWMIVKVRGELVQEDSVIVQIQPLLLLSDGEVMSNPLLDNSHYFIEEE
tara:strand:- start:77222 stop:77725 length:504 start_codon:yes stop_codon:yes gene_type:complete